MKRIILFGLILALLLCGCSEKTESPEEPTEATAPTQSGADTAVDPGLYFSDRDFDTSYKAEKAVALHFEGTTISCAAKEVRTEGTTATITEEGTYILTGTLEDGTVLVDVEKTQKVQLVLSGVSITNRTGAALYIKQADKVFITTVEGTENTLSNGGSFENADDGVDGAVFSREDITFNGAGKLSITSPAGHGIVSKDSLTVTSGDYEITCASHGMAGKDDVAIAGGTFTLTAGKDGIRAENAEDTSLGVAYIQGGTFTVVCEGDGVSASGAMQIGGGVFALTAGGGSENGTKASSDGWGGFPGQRPGGMGQWPGGQQTTEDTTDSTSMKGIKAGGDITITGGVFTIDSADDGIHSNASVQLTGGTFTIATGDDGVHAEDTLTIDGAVITIAESYEGLEALHIYLMSGDVTLVASDDGLNAAGGTDSSGTEGGRDGMFGGMGGGRPGKPGDQGGMGGFGGMMGAGNGSITIAGGTLHITASGDGIDANGTLTISGGDTTLCGPTQGDTAVLDYDTSAVITGGTFIGTGSTMMAQTFSDSEQGVIALSVGSQAAGTRILLTDAKGVVVAECTPALNFAIVIISTPDMVKGESYTITVGSQSGTFEAN